MFELNHDTHIAPRFLRPGEGYAPQPIPQNTKFLVVCYEICCNLWLVTTDNKPPYHAVARGNQTPARAQKFPQGYLNTADRGELSTLSTVVSFDVPASPELPREQHNADDQAGNYPGHHGNYQRLELLGWPRIEVGHALPRALTLPGYDRSATLAGDAR